VRARAEKKATASSWTSVGNGVFLLAGYVQRLAARHEQVKVGARRKERRELARRLEQVLEVVEEQEQPLVGDVLGEAVLRAERLGRRPEHELRVAERREWHPPNAVRIAVRERGRALHGEPRLTRTARTGEGKKAVLLVQEQRYDFAELAFAPEKRLRGNWEVCLVERLEWRKLFVPDLIDPLRR
jgi:hypothetical protein